MASITGFGSNVSGATGTTNVLEAKQNYRVYILPRGADAATSSTGSLISFDSVGGSSRFAANQWIQVGLDGAKVRQVTGAQGGSIGVNSAVVVTQGDHIFSIGSTQPSISGSSATYQPNTTIFLRSDDSGTPVSNSLLTTDANGLFQFFAGANLYDAIIQDANVTNVGYLLDVPVGISTDNTGTFGQTLSVLAGLTVSGRATIGQTMVVTGGVSIGKDLRVAYDTRPTAAGAERIAARIGIRAQTTGDNHALVYASETYDNDLTDATYDETAALYGINLITSNISAGADAFGVQGEVQYNPTAAKTATGSINGAQFWGRYGGTHASATAAVIRGMASRFICSTGATGTVTNARGIEVTQPENQGTAAITNYVSLFVQGASAGFATTANQVANFTSGDDNNTFLVRGSQIRIDDSFNQANSATAGRQIDIFKTLAGASATTTLYTGVHLTYDLRGSFTANDDVYGFRSAVRTNTTAGDGANLDIVAGYLAFLDHRSNATVDEMYGFDASMNHTTGSGIITTMAGLRSVMAPTAGQVVTNMYGSILTVSGATPSASFGSMGHMLMTPITVSAPATALAALTGAANGTMVFLADSGEADNSGLYIRINSKWLCLTSGSSTFDIAQDA